jgi:quercetin dioxygenase-like cupin family protein
MDLELIKSTIVTNVYHINPDSRVALHKHNSHNELFFCIKGKGFGVLENENIELSEGRVFVVTAGTMHSLGTDSNLWVSSFLISVILDEG